MPLRRFLIVVDMEMMQHAMENRSQNEAYDRHEHETRNERIEPGENPFAIG